MPDFKVTRYLIRTSDMQRGPETPFTAAFLSDLHNVSYGEKNSRLLAAIRNIDPEIIFVSGDMLTAKEQVQMDEALSLMEDLTGQYTVFYANGNHERRLMERREDPDQAYEKYTEQIRSYGVHLLENSSERIEIHRMPINVWGLDLPMEYYGHFRRLDLTKEQIDEMLGEPLGGAFQLLLAHCPLYFESYAAWGADLTLSGHLHGGIVRIPGLGGLISTQFRLFPKYDRGLFKLGDKRMVVSAGLGDHTIKLRINNPPELIALDFI